MNFSNTKLAEFIIENFIDSAYCVGYRLSEQNFWEEEVSNFRVLKPGIRYWYADPIPCSINDIEYVFVEQYDRFTQIGCIGVGEIRNGKLTRPKTILKRKTHMSFPVVIFYKGQYYMFPESSSTKSIEIFKMTEDPYHWDPYFSLQLNEKIVDSAVSVHENFLLLLTGIEQENSLYVKRQIVRIDNLEDINRISYQIGYTDNESSLKVRNGGNFQGNYRVIQESTDTDYGMFLALNKVLEFNQEKITEKFCKRKTVDNINVKLSRFVYRKIGIHTYGRSENNLEVIDLAVTKLSLLPMIRKWRKKK